MLPTEAARSPGSGSVPETARRGRGLILAAAASGSGKTLLAAGLLRHLRDRGIRAAAAKAGPDYIDPTFHAAASGRPCVNLDIWGMRRAVVAGLVAELESSADLVVCEGVMGLFDGTGPDGETGSTAALAHLTGWPVVLIVDARGQGASVAALVSGFANHDPGCRLAGVILNRVSGARHRALLEAALARHLPGVPCLGAVLHEPEMQLPARHLGLVPAAEAAEAEAAIARAATAIAAGVDVESLVLLAAGSRLDGPPQSPLPALGTHIAIAQDTAFAFAYPAILAGWRRQGATLSFFSPLADEPPDPTADAIYLPGGYPELHAARLSAAGCFQAGLRTAAAAGKPIYGECGGFMALGETLADANGQLYGMAGLLPLDTSFATRRLHLGYRCARLVADTPLGRAGTAYRAHEFHHATILAQRHAPPLFDLTDASGTKLGPAGLRSGSVFGSFIHLIDRLDPANQI